MEALTPDVPHRDGRGRPLGDMPEGRATRDGGLDFSAAARDADTTEPEKATAEQQ